MKEKKWLKITENLQNHLQKNSDEFLSFSYIKTYLRYYLIKQKYAKD